MASVDFIERVVMYPLVQIVAIHRKHTGIVVACDDLYRRFNRRQELAEFWQLRLVRTKKAYGFDETVPLVRAQEVLPHVIGKFVALNKRKNRLDPLTRIPVAKWLETGHVNDVFQHPIYLYGNGRSAVANDNAANEGQDVSPP